jgi:NitT/TauT family transport system ATP-binding protein
VGFVFQEGPLFPWRNVLDNAAFALEVRGMASAERRERARAVLELVGMSRADEHKRPYELSGGMQQRVAIAQALAADPKLLLLDEPFANLDEVTSRRLQEELVRIWQASGKTILFVTHLIEDAVFLGRRIIMMGGTPGRIVTEIETDLPYPRNRTDDLFTGHLLAVRRKFHEA